MYQGVYDEDTDPDDVPDEHIVLHITDIAVAGHATDADMKRNLRATSQEAPFDTRTLSAVEGARGREYKKRTLWAALYSDAATGVQEGVAVWFDASETE